jgi:hypothetical protein
MSTNDRELGVDERANCSVVQSASFSLDPLGPESKNGEDGSIRSRLKGGRLVVSHLNKILSLKEREALSIANDTEGEIAARMAAKWALRALSNDTTSGGIPIAGYEVDRIMDRTVGRPNQQIQVVEDHKTINVIQLTSDALKDAKHALNELT